MLQLNGEFSRGAVAKINFEEHVESEKTIYHGAILDLALEKVRLPNGKPADREIVHHHGAVGLIPLTDNGEIVLVKQWREPLRRVTLEIPAGKIEPGEDPLQTANRELNEEVRMKATHLEQVAQFYTSPGFADEKMTLFCATGLAPVANELPQDDDEFLELVSLTPMEMRQRVADGLICDAKTIMALWYWQLRGNAVNG